MENEDEKNKITKINSLGINDEETDNKENDSVNNTNNSDNNAITDSETERSDSVSSIDSTDDNNKKIKVNISKNEEIIISALLYITIGIITILVPKLKSMFNIVGCTAANSIQFIIPCLMIICLKEKSEKLSINLLLVKILLGFGIVSLIICFVAEFMDFIIFGDN